MKNTGSKPWQKSSHRLQAIGPTPLVWGSSVRDMDNSTQVDPEAFPGINDTATFTFTFDIPQAPGNYAFVWKMIEQGIAGDPFFEQATAQVAITVIDTTPPTAPSNLNGGNLTTNSLRLNWTASVENGPTLSYDVYRKINGVMTLVGNTTSTWWDFSGLVSGDTYTFRVIAKDGVGLTGTSADKDITTVYDPNLDNDGDTVANGIEDQLGLNRNDASDVRVFTYTYDKINQLKRGPGGQYNKDAEGNIKEVRP